MYSSQQKDEHYADVIIIGAGLSGMVAAYTLLEKEPALNILILEAKEHVGGRLFSLPMLIKTGKELGSFDLGGQFVSDCHIDVMSLLDKLKLNVWCRPCMSGKIIRSVKNGSFDTTNFYNELTDKLWSFKYFEEIEKLSEKVSFNYPFGLDNWQELDCTPMETFITEYISNEHSRSIARNTIQTSCGVGSDRLSVLFYAAFCNGTRGVTNQNMLREGGKHVAWISGGAQSICYEIKKKIGLDCVKTGEKVVQVKRNEDSVIIETENCTYNCKAAIVAVSPPQVLEMCLKPALPDNRMAILKKLIYEPVTKFVVTYSTAFWRNNGLSGDIINDPQCLILYCMDVSYKETFVLTGHANPNNTEGNLGDAILQELEKYFGLEALDPTDLAYQTWPALAFCPDFKCMDGLHQIRRPIGRLFWAGSETATEWYGHMNGAITSGVRSAIETLYEIRPQCLTKEDIVGVIDKGPSLITKHKDTWLSRIISKSYVIGALFILMLMWHMFIGKDPAIELLFSACGNE